MRQDGADMTDHRAKIRAVQLRPLPPLPALKHLGDLAGMLPTIVVDTREQTPLRFTRLQSIPGTLTTGDYSVVGLEELFAVERKSIADLVACCCNANRARFFRELHRLRGYPFRRLLVVGRRSEIELHLYRSEISPASVLGTLAAVEIRYQVPVVFAATPARAAALVELWAWYAAREYCEVVNDILRGGRDTQPKVKKDEQVAGH